MFEDLIPLYPLYAILITDTSAGGGQVELSMLFILWSASTVLLETPTGVLADRFSRRRLLIAGPCVTATGFALWTLVPSTAAFAAGFVLWALGGSLRSGTMQALVYDELDALGKSADYARLAGMMRAAAAIGVIGGTVLAAPLFAWHGHHAVGAASVAACVLCALASALLPETRVAGSVSADRSPSSGDEMPGDEMPADDLPGDPDTRRWRDIVGRARDDLRRRPVVRRLLLLVVGLTGISALDEYLPLLAESLLTGSFWAGSFWAGSGTPQQVALLMAVIAVGDIAGSMAAGRFRRPGLIGPAVMLAAAVLGASALSSHPVAAAGVAVAFGVFGWAHVVADAALQDALDPASRATVTSVAGVGEEVVAVGAFAAWAVGSLWLSPPVLFALAAVPYLVSPAMGAAITVRASRR